MPEMFHRFPQNLISAFRGRNLLWHALAITLTIGFVMSGSDWAYFLATRGDAIQRFAFPSVPLGSIIPLLGTLLLLLTGAARQNPRLLTLGWALAQAALLGWLISTGYKALTGRIPPPDFRHFKLPAADAAALLDSSHGFRLGLLKGGMFWGWPSSHTTVNFAMATCLITIYPRNKPLCYIALFYALYIGLGISVNIHWFSEFVAGAIIGSVIGAVVGHSFKTRPV